MGVVWDEFTLTTNDREEDLLSSSTLMGWDDEFLACDLLDHGFETEEASCSCVGLITIHNTSPLFGTHGSSSTVGQQVNDDILGLEEERVVTCLGESLYSLFLGGELDGLYTLDLKWLNDGLHRNSEKIFSGFYF